jgi:hypothetical protein
MRNYVLTSGPQLGNYVTADMQGEADLIDV